ncbi:MAG: hypothetical protein ACR2IM_08590 [Sediminibacterium sp.]
MNRRKFVSLNAASLCLLPFTGFSLPTYANAKTTYAKPTWLLDLIKLNDTYLKGSDANKVKDTSNPYFGAYLGGDLIPNPHSTSGFINIACASIASPESIYYQSTILLDEIRDAVQGMLSLQHPDGSIDLLSTNFHSTPDTGFIVERLAQSYKLLKQSNTQGVEKVLLPFEKFLKQAGEILITGGIHTPNQRWFFSGALTKLYEIWPDQRYVDRANQWLSEHIDLDPDGQFYEKSTGGYSSIVDRALITIAIGLNKPELFEPVRKNLKMMRYYIHPNGEVVTEASNRQDKGTIGHMDGYYYAARYMALLDNDGEMAAICRLIERDNKNSIHGILNHYLEDPSQWKELPPVKTLPTNYVKSFPYSGVVRIRKGNWDTTILSNNAGWLTFHKGNAVLQAMRIATSFFGKGQFDSVQIKHVGESWVLNKKLEGAYFQPFEPKYISPDGYLSKMPKINRKESNVQYLDTTIKISSIENGIEVDIAITGTDKVPVSMELVLRSGGNLEGVESIPNNALAFVLKGKQGTYTVGNDTLKFGPGKFEHTGYQLRGALPKLDAPTVYLTGITPFKHTLQIS